MRTGHLAGFSGEFFEQLARLEERYFWFRERNALLAWALGTYFPDARTFLDAGAGTGHVAAALRRARPGLRCTLAEAFIEGLLVAAGRTSDLELVRADVLHLPWMDEFDVVGAFDVLEHVHDDVGAVRQLARAVKPGGGVIVTVPQHAWLWGPVDEHSRHVRRYSRRMLIDVLHRGELRIERVTSFVTCLLPALIVSRMTPGQPVDPMAEFRIPAAANVIGRAAMWADRTLVRAGVSLPVGGSLLAIARRPL